MTEFKPNSKNESENINLNNNNKIDNNEPINIIQNTNNKIETNPNSTPNNENNQNPQQINNNNINNNNDHINLMRRYYPFYGSTISPIIYCCGSKSRIWLKYMEPENLVIYFTFIIIIIPMITLDFLAYPKIENKKWKTINFIFGNSIVLITILSLLNVATSCPGYENTEKQITKEEFENLNPEINIKGNVYKLKYCATCKIIRQLRTSHCRICNKCVLRHDHHCPYINNCVGKNNHLKFLFFIFFVFIYSTYCSIFTIAFNVKEHKHLGWFRIIYLGIFAFISVWMFFTMGGFSISVIYYISINTTTRENIKSVVYEDSTNNGCVENWKEVCCD